MGILSFSYLIFTSCSELVPAEGCTCKSRCETNKAELEMLKSNKGKTLDSDVAARHEMM